MPVESFKSTSRITENSESRLHRTCPVCVTEINISYIMFRFLEKLLLEPYHRILLVDSVNLLTSCFDVVLYGRRVDLALTTKIIFPYHTTLMFSEN